MTLRAPSDPPEASLRSARRGFDPMNVALPPGWRLHAMAETGSTNADVAAAAASGAAEGLVVVAERQSAGRGRLGRSWESPSGAGLMFSVLVRPEVPIARWGWLSLLAGVALTRSVRATAGLGAVLKWPNDLLIDGRKCAGILAETAPPGAVVIGIGLNVSHTEDELPATPTGIPATSLLLQGARPDREALLEATLRGIADELTAWRAAGGDAVASGLRDSYLSCCATVDQPVRAILPDGSAIEGRASTVDADGRLVIMLANGEERPVAAADVIHVRPQEAKLDGRH